MWPIRFGSQIRQQGPYLVGLAARERLAVLRGLKRPKQRKRQIGHDAASPGVYPIYIRFQRLVFIKRVRWLEILGDWLVIIIRHLVRAVYLAFSLRSPAMMRATNRQRQPRLLCLYPNSPISEMTDEQRTYRSYLLRLWRVNTGRSTVWHASLEDSRTGERIGFADLPGVFTVLEQQTKRADQLNVNDKRGKL